MSNYPMVEQINLLIGNLLAEGSELYLPGIGTIYTERRPARKLSSTSVQPPQRVVRFSTDERGTSLVDHIARVAKCNQETAQEIFDRWITCVYTDEQLKIEGIGVLSHKSFKMDDQFEKRLNPKGHAPVKIKRGKVDWVLWCGIVAIVFAVAGTSYYFLTAEKSEVKPVRQMAQVVEKTQEAEAQPQVDSTMVAEVMKPAPEVTQQGSVAEPAALTSKRNYVVMGVFGDPENAERTLQLIVDNNPQWTKGVYRFGDKLLVSAFESDQMEECRQFINDNFKDYPEMWVYTAR